MISFPNAKINIGLFITGKREDGYHNLETIFYPIPSCRDALECIPAAADSFHPSGLSVSGAVQHNLALRAVELIRNNHPETVPHGLKILLHKAIPMGAGLGGGSADAAFMLSMLNEHFQLRLDTDTLLRYALSLGSDCPFFILNRAAYADGRGERLREVALDLGAYSIQLICPELHISTSMAFKNIAPKAAPFDLKNIKDLPVEKWKEHVFNDFEPSVFDTFPILRDIKSQLYEQGAIYASLSGTGSTIYGLFAKGRKAEIETPVFFKEFYLR